MSQRKRREDEMRQAIGAALDVARRHPPGHDLPPFIEELEARGFTITRRRKGGTT